MSATSYTNQKILKDMSSFEPADNTTMATQTEGHLATLPWLKLVNPAEFSNQEDQEAASFSTKKRLSVVTVETEDQRVENTVIYARDTLGLGNTGVRCMNIGT